MTKINDIQILDDIELENIVGGVLAKKKVTKKKTVKKKVVAVSSLAMNGGSNAVTVPDSAV